MKKFTLLLVAVLFAVGFSVSALAGKDDKDAALSGAKLGYVDLNRILNESNEGKAAKNKLEADGKAKKQKLEIMQNDLKKMKEDLDKQRLILSADALREKEGQFQQKLMELQKTSMDYEQQFSQAESQAIKPISDKIQLVIQRIGQSEGYLMIVPREIALYSPVGTDITEKVLAEYNKGK